MTIASCICRRFSEAASVQKNWTCGCFGSQENEDEKASRKASFEAQVCIGWDDLDFIAIPPMIVDKRHCQQIEMNQVSKCCPLAFRSSDCAPAAVEGGVQSLSPPKKA